MIPIIYEERNDDPNFHKTLEFNDFEKLFENDNFNNLDLNLYLYQKYYCMWLIKYINIDNYNYIKIKFNKRFESINFN